MIIFINARVLAIALAATSAPSSALTITDWRNDGSGPAATNRTTVRIQASVCRIDSSPTFTMLLDGESGYGYQILHPAKIYVRKKLTELQAASPCGSQSNFVPPVATGR